MFNLTKLSLLWEWVGELKKNVATLITEVGPTGENLLPSRSTATTGQILKLTGENKTPAWADEYSYKPPAYSETEVNTGQKWIDGKDIYSIVFSGTTGATAGGQSVGLITNLDKILHFELYVKNSTYNYYNNIASWYFQANGTVVATIPAGNVDQDYYAIVYYTKPDPAPETRDDETPEEPEAKKTRKKTTK